MRRVAGRSAVLLDETHDVAEIHRWQLQVTTCLYLPRPELAVGFQTFPRRLQPVLDRQVAGEMGIAGFLEAVEWEQVWASHRRSICRCSISAGSKRSRWSRRTATARW
ncbi:hypothetical protein GCM10011504_17280 [Siccirubricoccus deserti]|uniref:ChaN family lipoprotein n=1 Tax=Siccirubricoccus deserti TaxID=2013562 RepID=A0A9X0R0B1_9PROT|nr:ChaN family lipoprotein [Siccirubricoccus deserti]GGC39380.1 hypothetical protein GCM10011504_17280 [Siccirubricoccus deserti]